MKSPELTKEEVARREIEAAVRLFFNCEDAICVHLLANAAEAIVRDICLANIRPTFWGSLETLVRPDMIRPVRAARDSAYVFFKHAKEDPTGVYENFRDERNDFLIFSAIWDYQSAFDEITATMLIYRAWFTAMKPWMFTNSIPGLQELLDTFEPELKTRAGSMEVAREMLEDVVELQRMIDAGHIETPDYLEAKPAGYKEPD